MRCRYTGVYFIVGTSLPPGTTDVDVVSDATVNLKAILTSQPDPHLGDEDRSLGVANLLLNALFRNNPGTPEFVQRIAEAIAEVKTDRSDKFQGGVFLIVKVEVDVADFTPTVERDAGDFVLRLNGVDKDAIRDKFDSKITSILNSISTEIDGVVSIKQVGKSVIFFQPDGKPVYSYTFSATRQRNCVQAVAG